MNSEQQLRQIIKEELMALLSEDVVTYDDQMTAIEKMLFQIKDANASGNTALGKWAGYSVVGTDNVMLGRRAGFNAGSGNKNIYLGLNVHVIHLHY